ncbi:Uncharacterized conserved protein [Mesorhizobium albiziae]|uniref:Uncharacterized conserved protein n=1 Tax=Neomesorhizobium albiziae TaxID=335020 RepID=A0A1I3WMJ0_9HYPH|nr:YciI family protein [Mesorhizobium albiziae]GLS31678.1 hypothetical protein GCM10007937_33880 [Mesorhizobium albiziae]SFK07681.1 Uncharacterized conserved protein [Mesorhizobium albiziae]
MQYMLLIYGTETTTTPVPKEAIAQMSAGYAAYTQAMKKAGVWVSGDRLKPTQLATSVRVADGKTNVLDGPYADTKEQLGGYYLIDVPDMDQAIAWAARCPGASTGTLEVRPVWPTEM